MKDTSNTCGWSVSEGDIVQVSPNKGVSRTIKPAARRELGRAGSTPVTMECGQQTWNEKLISPILRDLSSYLFMKKPTGKQVQNLRSLPKELGGLFLLNNNWSSTEMIQLRLLCFPFRCSMMGVASWVRHFQVPILFIFFTKNGLLISERGIKREREIETATRERHGLPPARPLLDSDPATQVCLLTWNQTGNLSGLSVNQTTQQHWLGSLYFLKGCENHSFLPYFAYILKHFVWIYLISGLFDQHWMIGVIIVLGD